MQEGTGDENLWPVKEILGWWGGRRSNCFLLRGVACQALLLRLPPWAGVRTWPSKAVTRNTHVGVKGVSEGRQEEKARACPHSHRTPRLAFELVFEEDSSLSSWVGREGKVKVGPVGGRMD